MKKLWIKFEDTYGMFTLWNVMSHANLREGIHTFSEAGQNIFVSNSIGNRWVQLKKSEISFMQRQGLTDVVYVVDLDNIAGYKDKLLDLDTLQRVEEYVVEPLKKVAINAWFMPIVYAAESVFLLQYVKECTESIEGLVSLLNTTDLHLKLLRLFSKCDTNKEVKRVSSFLDGNLLLQGTHTKRLTENLTCYDWIQNSCEFKPEFLINIDQFMNLLERVSRYFDCKKSNTILDLLGSKVDLTKVIDYFKIRVNSGMKYALNLGPEITQIGSEVTAIEAIKQLSIEEG